MGAGRLLTRIALGLVDLGLPRTCGGCGGPGPTWCAQCRIDVAAGLFPAGTARRCPEPLPPGLPPTYSSARYAGAVRRALVAFKDDERPDLISVLGPLLAEAVSAARADGWVLAGATVVPVPSARPAVRRRGRDPVRELAAYVRPDGAWLGEALVLVRPVEDQSGLDYVSRAQNMSGAVGVRAEAAHRLAGRGCLLVDDVMTTGATLVASARAVRAAGATWVVAATVAATARRDGRSSWSEGVQV